MGLQARLMSQALRKLTAIVSKSKTCLIFINQIREKIGVMFGNPETTTGGRALKFYSSIRVDIRRIQSIKEGDRVVGSRTRAQSGEEQSGRAVPRSRIRHHLRRRHLARRRPARSRRDEEFLEKSGTWISYKGERLGQGRENARVFLKENTDIRDKIEADLRKALAWSTSLWSRPATMASPLRQKQRSPQPWPPPHRKAKQAAKAIRPTRLNSAGVRCPDLNPGPLSPAGTFVPPKSRKTVLITSCAFLRLSLQSAQARVFTVYEPVADNIKA